MEHTTNNNDRCNMGVIMMGNCSKEPFTKNTINYDKLLEDTNICMSYNSCEIEKNVDIDLHSVGHNMVMYSFMRPYKLLVTDFSKSENVQYVDSLEIKCNNKLISQEFVKKSAVTNNYKKIGSNKFLFDLDMPYIFNNKKIKLTLKLIVDDNVFSSNTTKYELITEYVDSQLLPSVAT
jgi:hypothetical protein